MADPIEVALKAAVETPDEEIRERELVNAQLWGKLRVFDPGMRRLGMPTAKELIEAGKFQEYIDLFTKAMLEKTKYGFRERTLALAGLRATVGRLDPYSTIKEADSILKGKKAETKEKPGLRESPRKGRGKEGPNNQDGSRLLTITTIIMNTTLNATMNSGDIFGPPVSTSKKRIIPRELLGPLTPGPRESLTIQKTSNKTLL